jgi:hypothetical protein
MASKLPGITTGAGEVRHVGQQESHRSDRGAWGNAVTWFQTPPGMAMLSVAIWSMALDVIAVVGARFVAPVPHPGRNALTAAWQQWDANWYARIVSIGYHAMPDPTGHGPYYLQAAFYPGFPLAARGVYEVLHPFGVGASGAMLIINQLLVFAMALLVYRFAAAISGSEAVGLRTVRYLLLFPFAYFLLAPFTEAAFLTFLAGFCWALVVRRYGLACLFGAAASGTRVVGIVCPVILLVCYLEQHRWRLRTLNLRIVAYSIFCLAGAAGYALYQWIVFSNPFYSEAANKAGWARGFTLNVWPVLRHDFTTPYLTAGYVHGVPLEAFISSAAFVVFLPLSRLVWRRYSAWLGLLCLALVISPIVSGSMLSYNRYMLPLIPCFVVLAVWGRHQLFDFFYRTVGGFLLVLFLLMFVHGVWTG